MFTTKGDDADVWEKLRADILSFDERRRESFRFYVLAQHGALPSLVAEGRDFSEAEKRYFQDLHTRLVSAISSRFAPSPECVGHELREDAGTSRSKWTIFWELLAQNFRGVFNVDARRNKSLGLNLIMLESDSDSDEGKNRNKNKRKSHISSVLGGLSASIESRIDQDLDLER